ncbi:MAG: ankyrin repeat domain-containing protein [Alphaproteobacteria bacterium]|nr:ankyrin repeat domain-containing protein [Alphaproteobacteria bacterium]OJV11934.1 MAG: hypothetical protein BGO27_00510 [Alphaproteobacteria bacterium 33-17]
MKRKAESELLEDALPRLTKRQKTVKLNKFEQYLKQNKHHKAQQLIKQNHILPGSDELNKAFLSTVTHANLTILKLIIKKEPNLDFRYEDTDTALHVAAKSCIPYCLQITSLLCKAGADPNVENHLNRTPLYNAIIASNINIIETLLEYGADPNHRDYLSYTGLHDAILYGKTFQLIHILINHGADFYLETKDHMDSMHIAIERNHFNHACFLFISGYNVNQKNSLGEPLLHYVVRTFKKDAVSMFRYLALLISENIDINITNAKKQTGLDLLLQLNITGKYTKPIALLIAYGATTKSNIKHFIFEYQNPVQVSKNILNSEKPFKINKYSIFSVFKIRYLTRNFKTSLIELLLSAKKYNLSQSELNQIMVYAIQNNENRLLRKTLKRGADPIQPYEFTESKFHSPLYYSIKHDKIIMAITLLQNNIHLQSDIHLNKSLVHALRSKHDIASSILILFGAKIPDNLAEIDLSEELDDVIKSENPVLSAFAFLESYIYNYNNVICDESVKINALQSFYACLNKNYQDLNEWRTKIRGLLSVNNDIIREIEKNLTPTDKRFLFTGIPEIDYKLAKNLHEYANINLYPNKCIANKDDSMQI